MNRGRRLRPIAYVIVAVLVATAVPAYASVVRTKDIANGAVTAAKIRNGGVRPTKIAEGAVTTEKLRDDAVTGEKLGDGAVTSVKLAGRAVTASKLGSITRRTVTVTNVANNAQITRTAFCLTGEVVLSGGALFLGQPNGTFVVATRSNGNGWQGTGRNTSGSNQTFQVEALCLES